MSRFGTTCVMRVFAKVFCRGKLWVHVSSNVRGHCFQGLHPSYYAVLLQRGRCLLFSDPGQSEYGKLTVMVTGDRGVNAKINQVNM